MSIVKVGMQARARQSIKFIDGQVHHKNHVYLVTESTLAYFKLHTDEYEFLERTSN